MEHQTFIVDHVLEQIFGGLEVVPAPVETLLADDLLLLVMQAIEVGVSQALLNSIPLVRVERQHLGQQICSRWFDIGEQFLPALL